MNSLTRRSAGAFVLVLSSISATPAAAQGLGLFAQGGYFSMKDHGMM